ncbi:MAG: hypothetical protein AMJ93_00470 [Anaerolineae bacterium SM23_84]|nr:MAG: hypothetical protein AMJ93_00470 [Anaerolineae bacterium SM23_84]
MPIEVYVEDIVRLRKVHPCGSYEWRVVRIGADIGLKCLGCGRRILLPRSTFERRLKAFTARSIQARRAHDKQPENQQVPNSSGTEL